MWQRGKLILNSNHYHVIHKKNCIKIVLVRVESEQLCKEAEEEVLQLVQELEQLEEVERKGSLWRWQSKAEHESGSITGTHG